MNLIEPIIWTFAFVILMASTVYAWRYPTGPLRIIALICGVISLAYFLMGLAAIGNALRSLPHGLTLGPALFGPAALMIAVLIMEIRDALGDRKRLS